jgi:hypothetical protein
MRNDKKVLLLVFRQYRWTYSRNIGCCDNFTITFLISYMETIITTKARSKWLNLVTIQFLLTDFIALNFSYFFMNYMKRGTFLLGPLYLNLLFLFYAIWVLVSLFTRKYYLTSYSNYKSAFLLIARSNVYIIYALSFSIVLMGIDSFPSRLQIFGTCLILFLSEMIIFSLFYFLGGKKLIYRNNVDYSDVIKFRNFSIFLLIKDFILITAAFFLMNYFKRGNFDLSVEYENILFIVYGLWLVTSVFTRKFEKKRYRNFYYAFTPYIKSFFLIVAIMSFLIYAFNLFSYSRLQIFGAFFLLILLEFIFYYFYFISKFESFISGDIESIDQVNMAHKKSLLPGLEKIVAGKEVHPVKDKLRNKFLSANQALFKFIDKNLHLEKIDELATSVVNTHTLYNIEIIDDCSLSLLINLHKINDFRWINRYLLTAYNKIYNAGYFVGCVETIANRKNLIFCKYPLFLAYVFYLFHFLFHRIIPKLPYAKRVYFFLTKGINRDISAAEIFGRLYFCGFKLTAYDEFDNKLYFIAQRVKNPSIDKSPSYGPTIQLRRVGLEGKIYFINKFRTMHPYSEYLQEYMLSKNELGNDGKFKDDFRVTEWGRIMRKFWLDELPQIINFFRGDLSLVGVRALSEHYFNLYPRNVQDLRIKFKPGLVPPYYADMPKSFDEIVESEKRYLEQKVKSPFKTDVIYFSKALFNIIFKKARSQ